MAGEASEPHSSKESILEPLTQDHLPVGGDNTHHREVPPPSGGHELVTQARWGACTLQDARDLFSGAFDGKQKPKSQLLSDDAFRDLNFDSIYATAAGAPAAKPGRARTDKTADVVTASGLTSDGRPVTAAVDRDDAHLVLDNGQTKLDIDRKNHGVDYDSSEWIGNISNGQGFIQSKETGTKITYDEVAKKFVATDKNGKKLAQSDNQKELELKLEGMEARLGVRPDSPGGDIDERSRRAQERKRQGDPDDPKATEFKAYQDAQTGDWAIANKDVIIRTHRAEGYVEIQGKDGDTIRMDRGDDGKIHFYRMDGDKKGSEITEAGSYAGLDIDPEKGTASSGDRTLVDEQLRVTPTGNPDDSSIDSGTGELRGRLAADPDKRVDAKFQPGATPGTPGQTSVEATEPDGRNDFSWNSSSGFSMQAPDGSVARANDDGLQITDPQGDQTNLSWQGAVEMMDPVGNDIISSDPGGDVALWNGDTTGADDPSCPAIGDSDSGASNPEYQDATADTPEAVNAVQQAIEAATETANPALLFAQESKLWDQWSEDMAANNPDAAARILAQIGTLERSVEHLQARTRLAANNQSTGRANPEFAPGTELAFDKKLLSFDDHTKLFDEPPMVA